MGQSLRVALAQVHPVVGDLEGNARLVIEWIDGAREQNADLVCFPELVLTGYPPEDLVLKRSFVRDNLEQLEVVTKATKGITAVVGFVDDEGATFNAAAVMHDGKLKAVYHKVIPHNSGVFDEQRHFEPRHRCPLLEPAGVPIGVSLCADGAWGGAGGRAGS